MRRTGPDTHSATAQSMIGSVILFKESVLQMLDRHPSIHVDQAFAVIVIHFLLSVLAHDRPAASWKSGLLTFN